MANRPKSQTQAINRDDPESEPITEYDCKMVMLRAERHDTIEIRETVRRLSSGNPIPPSLSVIQRTNTYYGPKLQLSAGTTNYLLTAPGPDAQLLLWESNTDTDGFRLGWRKLAEVKAEFAEEQPQYDLCPYCDKPLKTIEHERMAAVGQCSKA